MLAVYMYVVYEVGMQVNYITRTIYSQVIFRLKINIPVILYEYWISAIP